MFEILPPPDMTTSARDAGAESINAHEPQGTFCFDREEPIESLYAGEYSLMAMERDLLIQAFKLHVNDGLHALARAMGINAVSVYEKVMQHNLMDYLIGEHCNVNTITTDIVFRYKKGYGYRNGNNKSMMDLLKIFIERNGYDPTFRYHIPTLEKELILRGLHKYPNMSYTFISDQIGTFCERTLYRRIKEFGIEDLKDTLYEKWMQMGSPPEGLQFNMHEWGLYDVGAGA